MGSGLMWHGIKYNRIPGIKLPLFFRICFFTLFIQNAKKEAPVYKILVQVYYQVGNLYLVVSGQALELPKQRILMMSYYCLVFFTWLADYIVLKYFDKNRNESIVFEMLHCQIIDNVLIIIQSSANRFIAVNDIKEIRLEYREEKLQLIIAKEKEQYRIDIDEELDFVMEEYAQFKQILLGMNPLLRIYREQQGAKNGLLT